MKLVACYSYRYDKKYIPGMLKNLDFVDEFISHDDSLNPALWYHEGRVRNRLIRKAKQAGADWILGIDPDERFEKKAGDIIRKLIEVKKKIVYAFPFKELWDAPDQFRNDGIWGQKLKPILFPVYGSQRFENIPIHSRWHPLNPQYKVVRTDVILYHLKSIKFHDRKKRRSIYLQVDGGKSKYNYLDKDGENKVLYKIPKGRGYYPELPI